MSSAEPAPDETTVEVKAEENAGGEANATVTVATEPGPTNLSKQQLELLDGILRRLTEYRDEEYVIHYLTGAFVRRANEY